MDKVFIRLQCLANGAVAGRRNRRGYDAQGQPGGDDTGAFQRRQVPRVRWYLMSPEEMAGGST